MNFKHNEFYIHLWTNNELEDGNLFSQTLLSQKTSDKISNSGLTFVTCDSLGVRGGDSPDGSDGKDDELHDGTENVTVVDVEHN